MTVVTAPATARGPDGPRPGDRQSRTLASAYRGEIWPDYHAPGVDKRLLRFLDLPHGPWTASTSTAGSGIVVARSTSGDHCGFLYDFCAGATRHARGVARAGELHVAGTPDPAWRPGALANPADFTVSEYMVFEDLSRPGHFSVFEATGRTGAAFAVPPGPVARTPAPGTLGLVTAAAAALGGLRLAGRRRGSAGPA